MKAIYQLAACGILALTFNFANAAVLAANVAESVEGNQIARQGVIDTLGVRAGASAAEIEAAIASPRFSAAEKAAIAGRLNEFARQYVAPTSAQFRAQDNELAKSLFKTPSGAMIQ